jgi:hypothetical protein
MDEQTSERIAQLEEELERLKSGEEPEEDPLLARLTVKTRRSYTLSEAALEARRQNAQKSTGPVTPEGKEACSMNAWKHGQHSRKRILSMGKPCKSTCPSYPCYLVDDGATQPGQQCLDKEYMLTTINALSKAMGNGDLTDLKDVITLQLGGTIQVIDELQASILQYGVYMKSEKLGKDGAVIGYELKPNPSLLPLANLLKAAGVTMPEFMVTPAAVESKKASKEAIETLADVFRGAGAALAEAQKKKE